MSQDAPEYEYMNLLADSLGEEPALYTASITAAQAALPGWTPRPGNTETVLFEGFAAALGVDMMALRMVDSAVVESLMVLYGVIRSQGTAGIAMVSVRVLPTTGLVPIPVGTIFQYVDPETGEAAEFATQEGVEVDASLGRVTLIPVMLTEVGSQWNGLGAGLVLMEDGEVDSLESVELYSPVEGGTDEEDDESFFSRASAMLTRQTSALVTPEHFQLAALEVPGVGRSYVLDRFDPVYPTEVRDGHVTVAVADKDGEPLSSQMKAAVMAHLSAMAVASLTVHVIDPSYFVVDVAVKVRTTVGADGGLTFAAVQAALKAWLSPASWPWSKDATAFDAAGQILANVQTVQAVLEVTGGATTTAPAPLARARNITVTVEAGQ